MDAVNDFMSTMLTGLMISIAGVVYVVWLLNKKAPAVSRVAQRAGGNLLGNFLLRLFK